MKPPETTPGDSPRYRTAAPACGTVAVTDWQSASAAEDPGAPIHDCWNLIGVEGNATCRELVKNIHCRNCPVYSAAGLQLLDRPLPADYRRERAAHYAQEKEIVPRAGARLSVVIFRLANEWLALPTAAFVEVVPRAGRAMHTLPSRTRDRRGVALGLVNVRGELLICASVARLLGLEMNPESVRGSFARLLVASWNGLRIAFPVDEVHGLQRLAKDELQDPPATISKSALTHTQAVFGWRDRTVGLLDADSFFTTLNRNLA